jgi:hypothetical protein
VAIYVTIRLLEVIMGKCGKKANSLEELLTQINALEGFVKNTWWMARRYVDGRSTYAPGVYNEAVKKLQDAGLGSLFGDCDEIYASDGMFGEWDPELERFTGKKIQDTDRN